VKKTSVYLAPDLDEALARRAADEGLTKAEFIRRTLAAAVQRPPRARLSVGVVRSGRDDASANVDRELHETGFGVA
jgi:ribbon-helix-helix CopG family protein